MRKKECNKPYSVKTAVLTCFLFLMSGVARSAELPEACKERYVLVEGDPKTADLVGITTKKPLDAKDGECIKQIYKNSESKSSLKILTEEPMPISFMSWFCLPTLNHQCLIGRHRKNQDGSVGVQQLSFVEKNNQKKLIPGPTIAVANHMSFRGVRNSAVILEKEELQSYSNYTVKSAY